MLPPILIVCPHFLPGCCALCHAALPLPLPHHVSRSRTLVQSPAHCRCSSACCARSRSPSLALWFLALDCYSRPRMGILRCYAPTHRCPPGGSAARCLSSGSALVKEIRSLRGLLLGAGTQVQQQMPFVAPRGGQPALCLFGRARVGPKDPHCHRGGHDTHDQCPCWCALCLAQWLDSSLTRLEGVDGCCNAPCSILAAPAKWGRHHFRLHESEIRHRWQDWSNASRKELWERVQTRPSPPPCPHEGHGFSS